MTDSVGRKLHSQPLVDLLPTELRQQEGSALMSAYRMVGVSRQALSPAIGIALGDVALVLGWVALPALAIQQSFEPRDDGQIQVSVRTRDDEQHPEAPTASFISLADWSLEGLSAARDRIHAAVGLIGAVEGLPLVVEHVEDYRLELPAGQLQPTAVRILQGLWLSEGGSVEADAQRRWALAADAISSHPARERVELSLRWLDDAKRSEAVDAFLKLWFAIETLSMPDTTNIKPARDALAGIYGLSNVQAGETFRLGRVYDLRSKIVHDGQRVSIPNNLLGFLAGVYVDLLASELGFASSFRARTALDRAGGVANVLPSLVGGRAEEAEAEAAEKVDERLRSDQTDPPRCGSR